MAKDNVAEFILKHKTDKYKGQEYDKLVGSFECNGITHLISISCDGGGAPKIYTGQNGKAEGKNFIYARATSFRKGQKTYTKRNQSKV